MGGTSAANEVIERRATACRICAVGCGTFVDVAVDEHGDERVVKVSGDPDDPWSRGYTCTKGRAGPDVHHRAERFDTPLVRRNGELVAGVVGRRARRHRRPARGHPRRGRPGGGRPLRRHRRSARPERLRDGPRLLPRLRHRPALQRAEHRLLRQGAGAPARQRRAADVPARHRAHRAAAGHRREHRGVPRPRPDGAPIHWCACGRCTPAAPRWWWSTPGARRRPTTPICTSPSGRPPTRRCSPTSCAPCSPSAPTPATWRRAPTPAASSGSAPRSSRGTWIAPAAVCDVPAADVERARRAGPRRRTGGHRDRHRHHDEPLGEPHRVARVGAQRGHRQPRPCGRGDVQPRLPAADGGRPAVRPRRPRPAGGEPARRAPSGHRGDALLGARRRDRGRCAARPRACAWATRRWPSRATTGCAPRSPGSTCSSRSTWCPRPPPTLATHILPIADHFERGDAVTGYLQATPFLRWAPAVVEPLGERRPQWWVFAELSRRLGLPLFGSRKRDAAARRGRARRRGDRRSRSPMAPATRGTRCAPPRTACSTMRSTPAG